MFKRLALNSVWLFAGRLSSQVLGVIFTILVARRLGQAGLGQYAFVASVVFVANVLTTFGMDTLLMRQVAQARRTDSPTLGAALWIQLGLSAAIILVVAFGARLLPNKTPETVLALQVYSLALLPLAFFTIFSAVQRAFERMDVYLVANLGIAAIQTGGALVLFWLGGGLLQLAVLLLAAQSVGAVLAGWMCYRMIPGFAFGWRTTWQSLVAALRSAWPLALLASLGVVYQRLGVLLLSTLPMPPPGADAITGSFTAAARVVEALKIVHFALLGALFPVLARDGWSFGPGTTRPYVQKSFQLLLAFGLGVALILTFLAEPLVRLLYGPGYAASAGALKVLAWSLVPYAYSAKASVDLVTGGREGVVVKATALTLVLTGILFAIISPTYGLVGACLASLAGEFTLALSLYAGDFFGRRSSQISPLN